MLIDLVILVIPFVPVALDECCEILPCGRQDERTPALAGEAAADFVPEREGGIPGFR
jgi:uncharacterized metal-binding protein YceD (DUF177 family)